MSFVFYEPRTRRTGSAKKLKMTPAIRFSRSSIVVNVYARKLMEDNGYKLGPNLRIGFDPDSNAIRIESVEKGGVKLKKTKAYIEGMMKRFGLEWLAGQFIPVRFVNGGLEGNPVPPAISDEKASDEKASEEKASEEKVNDKKEGKTKKAS